MSVVRALRALLQRAVVRRVDETPTLRIVQLRGKGEAPVDAEHFEAYGFSGHPHPGAEALLLAIGGSAGHPAAVAISDRRHRPAGELAEGEVALYTDEGLGVVLRRGRRVEILGDAVSVQVDADCTVEAGGDVAVTAGGSASVVAATSVSLRGPAIVLDGAVSITGALSLAAGDYGAGDLAVAGDVDADGSVYADGDVSDGAGTMAGMRDIYNAHTGHGVGGPPGQQM